MNRKLLFIWIRPITLLLALCTWMFASTGCGTTADLPNQRQAQVAVPHKLSVVATFSILGDLVENVAGDRITLHLLVGPDSDAHTFEPSPTDSVTLAQADLIFENGLAFEPWLDDLYAASATAATRVVVSDGITPHKIAAADQQTSEEVDPHIWQDVANTMQMVQVIRDALMAHDAANAAQYQANADRYLAQLQDLDRWIQEQVARLPKERRKLVTSHDTLGYFASRYGFERIGSTLASASTEAGEPSAAQLAQLIDSLRALDVPAIFAENVHNLALAQRIAQEAGVTLAPPLYTDALGPPGTPGDSYLNMMRYNVQTIVDALK